MEPMTCPLLAALGRNNIFAFTQSVEAIRGQITEHLLFPIRPHARPLSTEWAFPSVPKSPAKHSDKPSRLCDSIATAASSSWNRQLRPLIAQVALRFFKMRG